MRRNFNEFMVHISRSRIELFNEKYNLFYLFYKGWKVVNIFNGMILYML